MLIGSAIHEGLAIRYRQMAISCALSADEVSAIVLRTRLEWSEEHSAAVRRGLKACWAERLLGPTEQVVGAELCLDHVGCPKPIPGQCAIADLVTRLPGEGLVITDHKTTGKLTPYMRDKRLGETYRLWQLWDYAWRAEQLLCEPVVFLRHHLISLDPPRAEARLVKVTPEGLEAWRVSAGQWWALMVLGLFPQNFHACDDFGGCPFLAACHTLYSPSLDDERLTLYFDRKG